MIISATMTCQKPSLGKTPKVWPLSSESKNKLKNKGKVHNTHVIPLNTDVIHNHRVKEQKKAKLRQYSGPKDKDPLKGPSKKQLKKPKPANLEVVVLPRTEEVTVQRKAKAIGTPLLKQTLKIIEESEDFQTARAQQDKLKEFLQEHFYGPRLNRIPLALFRAQKATNSASRSFV